MKPQRFRVEKPDEFIGWAFYPLPTFFLFRTPGSDDDRGHWGVGAWFLFWGIEVWFPKLYSESHFRAERADDGR